MKVIAQRGESVLVDLGDPDDGGLFQIRRGCVVDVRRSTVSRPGNIGSMLAHGYWMPYSDDPERAVPVLPPLTAGRAVFKPSRLA